MYYVTEERQGITLMVIGLPLNWLLKVQNRFYCKKCTCCVNIVYVVLNGASFLLNILKYLLISFCCLKRNYNTAQLNNAQTKIGNGHFLKMLNLPAQLFFRSCATSYPLRLRARHIFDDAPIYLRVVLKNQILTSIYIIK